MSVLYFKSSSGTLVCIDCEEEIDVSRSNTVSSSSVMSGRSISDEIIKGNLRVSVTGVITYSKTSSQENNPTPEEWIDLMEDAISNKERFTLQSTKWQGNQPLLKDYPNMVVADYGYLVDNYEDTITVRVVFQEVFISDSATTTTLAPLRSSSTEGAYDEPTTGSSGTKTEASATLVSNAVSMLTNVLTTDEGE